MPSEMRVQVDARVMFRLGKLQFCCDTLRIVQQFSFLLPNFAAAQLNLAVTPSGCPRQKSWQRSDGSKNCQRTLSSTAPSKPIHEFASSSDKATQEFQYLSHRRYGSARIPPEVIREDWSRIDIAKVGFGMLKAIEVRHPEHSSKMIQLHPPAEHDLEVRLSLEPGEEVVGFQVKEARKVVRKWLFGFA